MRILITTDAIGGVWTYTKELTRQLLVRGHSVLLVCFGPPPIEPQSSWMAGCPRLEFQSIPLKLEWMSGCEHHISRSREALHHLIATWKPDLLHTNQFCFGDLCSSLPCLLVAHSDVVSWWHAVHGCEPDAGSFPGISHYRELVHGGISGAHVVVGVSRWTLSELERNYDRPRRGEVVYNGLSTRDFNADAPKMNRWLAAGRFWDEGKNLSVLQKAHPAIPIFIAGNSDKSCDRYLGQLTDEQMRDEYAHSNVFVSPSLYEPFGLAPLEAALSGCSLLLSDIPSLREIWGEHATYFNARDITDLNDKWRDGVPDRAARQHALANYTSEAMVERYLALYNELSGARGAAA